MKLAYQLQTQYIKQAQVEAQNPDEEEEEEDEEGVEANGQDDEDFYDPRQN